MNSIRYFAVTEPLVKLHIYSCLNGKAPEITQHRGDWTPGEP